MDFIGREKEMRLLENQYLHVEHPLIIVKGRRRVGKSRLIKEFCKDKPNFFFQANRESAHSLLSSFNLALSKHLGVNINPDTWEDAISMFVKLSGPGRKILVIDEFTYITKSNRDAEKEFQSIWDNTLSKEDVMFILCGSYKGLMEDLTDYGGALYGRNTCDLTVLPLQFRDCIRGKDYRYAVEEYAFTGGIPHYMELMDRERPVLDNIERLTMSLGSPLMTEISYLMEEEFRDTAIYNTLLKTIAQGNRKMESITSATRLKASDVMPYLSRLIGMGMVESKVSQKERSPEKSRNRLYTISDRFIAMWYRFVYPYKNDIALGINDEAVRELNDHYIDSHVAFVFEDISRSELRRYLRSKSIAASYGSYWDGKTEIDVVAIDSKNKTLYAGECKYRKDKIGAEVVNHLVDACSNLRAFKEYEVILCFFSASGYTEAALAAMNGHNALVFDNGELITEYGMITIGR